MATPVAQQHILAIDNNLDVLGLFTELLEGEGYRVSTDVYVDRNLARISELDPDLIIIDYMWANEDDGWSLLQTLRMNPPTATVPIILCTGAITHVRGTEGHLRTMGIDVVLKPFNIDQLLAVIRRRLALPAPLWS